MINKIILFIVLFFIGSNVFAVNLPMDWLLLEYKFDWSVVDTSWNNITNDNNWVTVTYDSSFNTNFASFNSWKISTNLWWSTDEYGKYTISFWYKWVSWRQAIVSWLLSADWNLCQAYTREFNCSNLFDNNWHHIILRKNWLYNRVYIDWKLSLDYQWAVWALNYKMDIWYGSVSYLPYSWAPSKTTWNFYMNWKVMAFRVYNRELLSSEIVDLYGEYSYVQNSNLSNLEYTVLPLSSWTTMYWTWSYTVSFDVSTLLSQRINNYNRVYDPFVGWNDYPQTIFSTVTTDSKSLNLVLTNNYLCSTPYWNFDCSVLKDEKNHAFLIRKNNSVFEVYIDWNKIYTANVSWIVWNIWNTLSTYNSTFSIPWNTQHCTIRYSWYDFMWFVQNWVNICSTKNQFLWNITWMSVYNWYMSYNQLYSFFAQKWYSLQENVINWVLNWYSNNVLKINFTWISELDKKDIVDYEYSFDWSNYIKIASWSLMEEITSSWSIIYNTSVDISWQADWKWYVYFRTNNNWNTKFITKITFVKQSSYDININQPSTNEEKSKTITASFSQWTLYMSLTRSTVCNNTLSFENYNSLIFNGTKDNGIRICYKWLDSNNKEYYKLSNPIEWIISDVVVFWVDIFDYFTSWKYSPNIRNNDSTFMMLSLLANWSSSFTNGSNQTTTTTSTSMSSMVDINWDWLIDLLYVWLTNWNNKRSIMVNNWDFTFNTAYKCVSNSSWYYWDCAWSIDLWN